MGAWAKFLSNPFSSLRSCALSPCPMVKAQPLQAGGGGGNSGFQPIPVGNGWAIVEIQNRTTETVTTVNNYSGNNVTEVITKNNNDGQGGLWYQNGVPMQFEPGEPANGNVSARWEVQGTFYFRLQYQGEGSTPPPVPIECWQEAYGYHYEDIFNSGNSQVSNGLGSPQIWSYEFIPNCNKAAQSIGGELKIINAEGTEATYETPQANAVSYSNGWNAAAYSAVAMSLRPTNKSLAIWNSASPIQKAVSNGTTNYTMSFKESTQVTVRQGPSYIPIPYEPTTSGIGNFKISYILGRPLAKKHVELQSGVGPNGEPFHVFIDHNQNVPFPFHVWHDSAASPMGTSSQPDAFSYSAGATMYSPPLNSIPSSAPYSDQVDYVKYTYQNVNNVTSEMVESFVQETENFEENLSYKWGDGVSGNALASTELRPKIEIVDEIFVGDALHDLRGWKDLTPNVLAGEGWSGTVDVVGDYISIGSGVISLASAGGNPYIAALAAIAGITTSVIDMNSSTAYFSAGMGTSYKAWPENWTVTVGAPSGASIWNYQDRFRWRLQIMEASDVRVKLVKKFGLQGFQGMDLMYEYSRDPLKGDKRTLFWHPNFEGGIPNNWWTT